MSGHGVSGPSPAPHGSSESPEAEAVTLSDAYVAARMNFFPVSGTLVGYPDADHGRLDDNSLDARARWEHAEDDFLARAKALPDLPPGSRGWVAKAILLETLESAVSARACRAHLRALGSSVGWHTFVRRVAAVQPVGSEKARGETLRRFRQVPVYVENEIANQREGLRLGYVANRQNAERMRKELDALLALPPEKWPLLIPTERDADSAFREALIAMVRDNLVPVAKRHRDFLATDYLPKAHESFGLAGTKDGEACYRASIRVHTTEALSAQELHALGLRRLEELGAEMASLGEKAYGTREVSRTRTAVERDPRYTSASPAQTVRRAEAALERARTALPTAFHRLPRGRVTVKSIPEFQAKEGVAAHHNGSMTAGGYEGIYWINTSVPSSPRDESVAFHEGIPGHHMQRALAAEGGTAPRIARYVSNNAYGEGWALYAERLADELALYSSASDRAGMIIAEAFRAARLVVDTGIHVMGWTREQALQFMLKNVSEEPLFWGSEVDRYASLPGQALAYEVGALEIRRLRDAAKARLGARFDLASFHDVVLESILPLPMLRERVELWLKQQAARP